MPRIPRGRVDGSRLAHSEVVGEVRMAERSPEVEGLRLENDRMSWQNPDRKRVLEKYRIEGTSYHDHVFIWDGEQS